MRPEEVAELQRLAREFRDELAALGNSVQAVNRKLDNLSREVADLRARIDRMPQIYGHFWMAFRTDIARDAYTDQNGVLLNTSALKEDAVVGGRAVTGTDENKLAGAVVNEFGLGVRANIVGGAMFDGELLASTFANYEGGVIGVVGAGYNIDPATSLYVHHAMITTPFDAIGRGSQLTVGRFGEQLGHLVLWKPNTDLYLSNPFEDDGMYYIDGARLRANFGSVNTEFVVAKSSSNTSPNGVAYDQPFVGSQFANIFAGRSLPVAQSFGQVHMPIDELAAVSAGFGFNLLDKAGHLRLSALATSNNKSPADPTSDLFASTALVIGVDADIKLADRINVTADFAKSLTGAGDFSGLGSPSQANGGGQRNDAFTATVGYGSAGLSVHAGYRYIDPYFYAPGYWGRIGAWVNPTNIQGPIVRAGYDFRPGLGVTLGGEYYTPARNETDGMFSGDTITRLMVGTHWDATKALHVTADWEGDYYRLGENSSTGPFQYPSESFVTIGTGYNLTANTEFKLACQFGGFRSTGNSSSTPIVSNGGADSYWFDAITGQVSVRF